MQDIALKNSTVYCITVLQYIQYRILSTVDYQNSPPHQNAVMKRGVSSKQETQSGPGLG